MVEQPMNRALQEPILDQGIHNIHFFNGRLLTAADLKTEQDANRRQHRQLGQAVGEGVAWGMEVGLVSAGSSKGPPVVSVTRGLALNRNGQAVALPIDVQVALARQSDPLPIDGGLFSECSPSDTGSGPSGKGAYILIAYPASGYEEQAPMVGLATNGKAAGCGRRYAVEGIQFRLEELKPDAITAVSETTRKALSDLATKSDPASLSRLRNLLAHLCFGTEELAGFALDPFRRVTDSKSKTNRSPFNSYGALDALRAQGSLIDCDVPVALVFWPTGGVKFVDMWSVRRRPIPVPRSTMWPLPISERRQVEAEAIFLQFEDQVESLTSGLSQSTLASAKATDYFFYLPPAGLLPVRGGAFGGFVESAFFGGLPYQGPTFIDRSVMHALLNDSTRYLPIDLSQGELVWLYKTWQSQQAIDAGGSLQPYVVFASGHMPDVDIARYDLSRWDDSNYVGERDW